MKLTVRAISLLLLCFILASEGRVMLVSCLASHQVVIGDEGSAQTDAENEGEERAEDSNELKEKFFAQAQHSATELFFSLSNNAYFYNCSAKCNPHFEVISPPPQMFA